jgi:hypothetical protein
VGKAGRRGGRLCRTHGDARWRHVMSLNLAATNKFLAKRNTPRRGSKRLRNGSATRSGSRRLPGAARRRISRNYDAPRSQIDRAPSRAEGAPGALRTSAQAPRIAFPPIVGGRCAAQWLRLGLTCGAVNANEGQPPAAETGGSIPPTAILPTRSTGPANSR